jgi:hypothetical protein
MFQSSFGKTDASKNKQGIKIASVSRGKFNISNRMNDENI